jgi:AraC-like DNA-binding protein
MRSLAGFLDIVILFGAVQGLIVSLLLYFYNNNKTTSRLLALLIFLLTLASLNIWLLNQPWSQTPFFQVISAILPMVIIMPVGPLLYLYTRKTLDPEFAIGKSTRVHFYSVAIDLLPHIVALCFITGVFMGVLENNPQPVATFIDNYNVYSDIPRWLSTTIYLAFSFRYMLGCKNAAVDDLSKKTQWLQQLHVALGSFQIIWFIYLIPYVIPSLTDKMLRLFNWYPIYVPLSVLIYWLGFKGYMMQNQALTSSKANKLLVEFEPETVKHISALLLRAMEEQQYYLNPDLSLNLLANHIAVSPKSISTVLNQYQKTNFNDFVNEYRIIAFKEKYGQPQYANYTIIGIAFECGFKSQPTFQRAFKQFTGCTPTDFSFSGM